MPDRKPILPWPLLTASLFGLVLAVCLCRLRTQYQFRQTITNGTVVVRAVESFRAARQFYPDTLDDLVPEFIPEIPPASWGQGLWIYRCEDDRFTLQVSEDGNTGDGNSHWLQYSPVSRRWDMGD